MMTTSQIDRAMSYVNALELPPSHHLPIRTTRLAVLEDDKPGAAVNAGSLVSFVSNLTGEHKQDVLNSTLLAQLAATKLFDRYKQTSDWYNKYLEVLNNVGWVTPAFAFRDYQPSGSNFTVNSAVLEILAAIATDSEIAIVASALNALKDDSNEKQLSLFENNSFPDNLGCFQIFPVSEDKGDVVMALSAMQFTTDKHVTKFLWFTWVNTTVKLFQSAQKAVLNEDVYGKIRQAVVDKLGDNAQKYIDNIEI